MSLYRSEELGGHDRSLFQSGNTRIDRYFQTAVSQDVKRNYARCFVLVEQATTRVAGFYTLSAATTVIGDVPNDLRRKLPAYPTVPLTLIGWLGRDQAFHGKGIGAYLLADAIQRIARSGIGAFAIVADAIDEAAAAFYHQHQFRPLASGRMFLTMKDALAALEG